ncbi:MAG: nucleotidyltransferase family protein [Clostridia bacterium]|nr:nucleotidyltransferase family protein [Clostridia bacterium]
MRKAAYDMLYLSACAINGVRPDAARCDEMELEKVYKISARHSLAAVTAMALSSSGVAIPQDWSAEKEKALRKNILFDAERAAILRFMEENGIWYMPLKGVIIKDMYPKMGMRQMADNDILYDAKHQNVLMEFMAARGYDVASVGKGAHDTYYKAPIYNFEMHTKLFAESKELFFAYYENVKERLIPVEGKSFAYRFSDEDYYIYVTAHEYKHFSARGTGLRSLLDRYVYLSKKKELDICYIEKECEKLGIAQFERESRALCLRVFSSTELPVLSESEEAMLSEYLFSGTYGTLEKLYKNKISEAGGGKVDKKAKRRYIWQRIFPPMSFYKDYSPTAYKYKILIPFVWFKRILRAIFKRRTDVKKELDAVNKIK